MLVGTRRLLSLIATVGALGALGVPTQAPAEATTDRADLELQVNREHQGHVVATIEDATAGEEANIDCATRCLASYVPGRVVTLRAEPAGAYEFGFWSE